MIRYVTIEDIDHVLTFDGLIAVDHPVNFLFVLSGCDPFITRSNSIPAKGLVRNHPNKH